MTVTINQKRDKFAGVMFGDDIDSTYKKAWKKVLNPPRLNIYVPVKVNDNKEFAITNGNLELLNNNEEIDSIVQKVIDSINNDSNSVFELIMKNKDDDIMVKVKKDKNFDFKLVCSPFSKIFGEEISLTDINPIVPDLNSTDSVLYIHSDVPEQIQKEYFNTGNNSIILYNKIPQILYEGPENIDKANATPQKTKDGFIKFDMFADKYEYLPYGKYVDFYIYHNNYSGENLTIGVLLKCESYREYPVTIEKFYEMETGVDTNKYIKYAELGKDFLNKIYEDKKDEASVKMKFGNIGFAIANNVPHNSGVNGILRIKCDSSFVRARVVAVKSEVINNHTDWNKIWKEGVYIEQGNKYNEKVGQFAGSVNYSQISVKAKMKVGQFFSLAGSRNQNSGNEYPNPIDYKEAGRNFLFGNYGVVYNIEITIQDKQKDEYYIEIYPFGHNTTNNQDLILYTKRYGFYTTGAIKGVAVVTGSNDKNYTHTIKTSYLKDNNKIKELKALKAHKKVGFLLGNDKDNNVIRFKFVLPGAGSGNIKFKLVDNQTCDDSTLV